jgi:CRISPR-associated protein Csm4
MARIAYRLTPSPGGGFHLGREGMEQESSAESFPSDSLFAALMAALVDLEGEQAADDFAAEWPQPGQLSMEPPFRLSSLFPLAGDLPLSPMPRLRVKVDPLSRSGKQLKKLEYVSPAILNRLLSGESMDGWLPGDNGKADGLLLQKGKVWIGAQEQAQLPEPWRRLDLSELKEQAVWASQPVPRVTIDRVSHASVIYHVGRTAFAQGCGLWMLAEVNRYHDLLETLLADLTDRGIGGKRVAGYGAFTLDEVDVPSLPIADRVPRVMTLSRYSPTHDELNAGVLDEQASYELVDVGGWLASPVGPAQRRRRLRLIEAGSVLVDAAPITGQIVDVRPEYDQPGAPPHPVYRSGIALTIGVTAKEND